MSTSSSNIPVTVVQADKNQSGVVTTKNQTMPTGEKLFLDGISFSATPAQAVTVDSRTSLMMASATLSTTIVVDGNFVSFISLVPGGNVVTGAPGKVVTV